MKPRQRSLAAPQPTWRSTLTRWLAGLICILLLLAFLAGLAFNASPERQAMLLEEQRTVLPYRIIARITGYVVFGIVAKVGIAVLSGYGLFYLLAIGRNWLDLRARQVHPRHGLFPVIQLAEGVLYDPNRDNAGAHPLITLAALGVQKQAATQADRLIIRQVDRAPWPKSTGSELRAELPAVNLPEMIRLADIAPHPSLEKLVLGVGENGLLTASLYELMHVLAVGAPGFGKSAWLRALICQLAQVPEDVRLVGIDCFGSELNAMVNWERLWFPVAKELPQAAATLQAVTLEIARRKALYAREPRAFDLPSYNRLSGEPLPPIVVMVDEGTAMLNTPGIADPLREVVQTARQFGVYAMLAGQNVTHKVMPTQTRDNFSSRLCFHTSASSRHVVLGETAAQVDIKGRAWAQLTGKPLQQIQCPYVTREEVLQVIRTGQPRHQVFVGSTTPPADLPGPEAGVRGLPAIVEVPLSSAPPRLIDDDTLPEDARIRSLAAQGLSRAQIEQRVYGFQGGSAYRKVKEALDVTQ